MAWVKKKFLKITLDKSHFITGRSAFEGCGKLSSVGSLKNVTRICGNAFAGCGKLSSVGSLEKLTNIACGAFWGCSSLRSITVSRELVGNADPPFHYDDIVGYVYIDDGGGYIWHNEYGTELRAIKVNFIGSAISPEQPEPESNNDIKLYIYDTGDGTDTPYALQGASARAEGFGSASSDENGKAVIENNLTGDRTKNAKISVTQEGYREYYFYRDIYGQDADLLWNDNTEHVMMKMLQEGDDSNPYVSTLMCYAPGRKLQNGMVSQVSGDVKIQMNAVWNGKTPSSYTLYQKTGKNSYASKDGIFNLNINEAFVADKPVYAVLEAADGTIVEEKTALMPGEDGLEQETVDLIDTGSTGALGEDTPFLSGHELAVELKKVSITVSIDGNRIRAAIGPKNADWEKFFKNKNWADWKAFCEKEAGAKTMSEVSGFMKEKLTMKWTAAVEGSAGIYGFLEGPISAKGDTVISGGINIHAAVNGGLKSQYVVGVVPVYAKVSLGAEGTAEGIIAYNWTQKKIDAAQTGVFLEFEPALNVQGGVGVVDVLSVGVEGKGSLPFSAKVGNIEESKLSLKGHLALKVKLLTFEYSKVFAESEWQLLPKEDAGMRTARMSLPLSDDFIVSDDGYLQEESLWLGEGQAQAFSLDSAGTGTVEKVLKTNINPDADMQIVNAGSTQMILWTEGDANRSAINNSKLVYSVYDKDNGTWSEPAAVADDGTADFAPSVVSDGEHVYVAWQNISRQFKDDASLSEYAAASMVDMSVWTDGQGFSAPVTVSREGGMAAMPKISLNGAKSPYVAYVQNTDNDPLLLSGNNDILYSVIEDGNVEHKVFVEDAGLVTTMGTAFTDGYEVSYTLDTDHELSTLDDREVVRKGAKEAATKNSVMDSGIQYAGNGSEDIRFWYCGDAIVMSDTDGRETVVYQDEDGKLTDDFRVISGGEGQLALIWTAADAKGNKQIEGSLYDAAEGKWSKSIRISDTDASVYSPQGIFAEDGSLQLLYKKAGDAGTDLCILKSEPSVSLKVENAYAEETLFVPGETAKVRVQVRNNGTKKAESYTVDIDGTKTEIQSPLAPGEDAVIEADYMVPADFSHREICILAASEQEGVRSRAEDGFLLEVGYPDLAVDLTDDRYEFGQLMRIRVANESCVDTEATLEIRKGGKEGELLKSIALGNISRGGAVAVSYLWNAETEEYSADAGSIYFNVISEKQERYINNNYDFVAAAEDTRKDEPPAGEDDPSTGGDKPPAGEDDPSTGGDKPPAGGDDPSTGGDDPSTGGDDPSTGGDDPSVKEEIPVELSASKEKKEYITGDVLNIDDLVVTVKYSDGTSKIVTDYSTNAAKIDMGTPGTKTLKITYQKNSVKIEASVQIKVKDRQEQQGSKSIAGASVRLAAVSCAYTGKAQRPKVSSVTLGDAMLKDGRDYKVAYKNNRNIGKAAVIVTGIGDYTGSVEKAFSIKAKKGTKFTVGAYKYKITNQSEVAFAGIKSAKTKRVSIPKTAKIGGKKFKVTSIAARALKNKKVTSVTVGANVKTIGTEAFCKCRKLGVIQIKSTRLKSVGRNAFKGIKPAAKIKVPKKKLRAYKKLLKKKGLGSKVKIEV